MCFLSLVECEFCCEIAHLKRMVFFSDFAGFVVVVSLVGCSDGLVVRKLESIVLLLTKSM